MANGVITRLRELGYAVLPAPRKVEVSDGPGARVGSKWNVATDGVDADDVAVTTLMQTLATEHGIALAFAGEYQHFTIRLAVEPGAIDVDAPGKCAEQAYQLRILINRIDIVANASAGLFYGVQTLLQLLDGNGRERLTAPVGTITDWPQWPLRILHWDTKHHQERPETLRRMLDWTARFKCNAICFELEDKFAYPCHPIIGAPGAFTAEQMQELVDYALARHIQIIPNVQAPAHLCYVLKHDEFAALKCDGSNYQICMDTPEARKLLFEMYDDLCEATKGVEYFHVSTDEVYYAGICEKFRKPYNPENRSLTWVDYVKAAHEHLTAKGRQMLIWAEYPLLPEHVKMLPADLIDGIYGRHETFNIAEREHGMRVLAYHPIQGGEKLFPNYFAYTDARSGADAGRLQGAVEATSSKRTRGANVLGSFAAAWDDSGLHSEVFWLGWATMAQCAWHSEAVDLQQTVADFTDIFYGRDVSDMAEVLRDLQSQARFWEDSWDRLPSKVRQPGYGYSAEKKPVERKDLTLLPPALPSLPELKIEAVFGTRCERELAELPGRLRESDRLLGRLHANLSKATRNRYNIEVLISIANLIRHHLHLLAALARAESLLLKAWVLHKEGRHADALEQMRDAHERVGGVLEQLDEVFAALVATWEKSLYPRCRSVDGRDFVHMMDDVKDHFADRRVDLTYMTAPAESIGLPAWREALAEIMQKYAESHGLTVRGPGEEILDD